MPIQQQLVRGPGSQPLVGAKPPSCLLPGAFLSMTRGCAFKDILQMRCGLILCLFSVRQGCGASVSMKICQWNEEYTVSFQCSPKFLPPWALGSGPGKK